MKSDYDDDSDMNSSSGYTGYNEILNRWLTLSWLTISFLVVAVTFPFSLFWCFKTCQQYERAVIFRLGRVKGSAGGGLFFILPCTDSFEVIDIRTSCFKIPSQEILTKDSVSIIVDAVVYFHVSDPVAAVTHIRDYKPSVLLLASSTIRSILGSRHLAVILSEGDEVMRELHQAMLTTENWGVTVERMELRQVRVPDPIMQTVLAREALVTKSTGANVIASEGETKVAKALKEAAEEFDSASTQEASDIAIQLRQLQTLNMNSSHVIAMPFTVNVPIKKTTKANPKQDLMKQVNK